MLNVLRARRGRATPRSKRGPKEAPSSRCERRWNAWLSRPSRSSLQGRRAEGTRPFGGPGAKPTGCFKGEEISYPLLAAFKNTRLSISIYYKTITDPKRYTSASTSRSIFLKKLRKVPVVLCIYLPPSVRAIPFFNPRHAKGQSLRNGGINEQKLPRESEDRAIWSRVAGVGSLKIRKFSSGYLLKRPLLTYACHPTPYGSWSTGAGCRRTSWGVG